MDRPPTPARRPAMLAHPLIHTLQQAKARKHAWELYVELEDGLEDARYIRQVAIRFLPPSRQRQVVLARSPFVHGYGPRGRGGL